MIKFIFESDKSPFFDFELLTWFQFLLVVLFVGLVLFTVSRFHLFSRQVKGRYIGYRVFLYLLMTVVVMAFVLIRPFVHAALLLVLFGIFHKSILSYTKMLFSLYYSKISFGDTLKIDNISGTFQGLNFGGLHLLTNRGTVYFPFNMWTADKITLESEAGKVLVAFECLDDLERSEASAVNDLNKSLFSYPFLAVKNVKIDKEEDVFKVISKISNLKYKDGFLSHIEKAGFRINGNKI